MYSMQFVFVYMCVNHANINLYSFYSNFLYRMDRNPNAQKWIEKEIEKEREIERATARASVFWYINICVYKINDFDDETLMMVD